MTQRPKPDAIGKPDVFDDSLSPAQIANTEANATNLKDVINALLSQMKRIMRGNNAGDWKDDPTVVARSLQDLNDAAVMPNPTGTDGRAITEEGSVAAYRNVKASALIGGFQSAADAAARDAIPAGQRTEGMMVRTNDDSKLWTLGSDLTTWTEFSTGAGGIQLLATWADLASIATPSENQHVLVADPSLDPADPGLAGPAVYSYTSAAWSPLSLLGGLYVFRSTSGTLVLSLDPVLSTLSQLDAQGGISITNQATIDSDGYATFGSASIETQLRHRSPRQVTPLPMDDSVAGGIGSLPGGPYDSVAASIKNALVLSKAANNARFMGVTTPQYVYVNPSGGSDSTGTGLTSGTAYATIQRAIDDIPHGFKTDIIVQIAAGSFSGQNFTVNVQPGFRTGSTSAAIYVMGDQTAAYTFASSGSGALVSGKAAQVQYTLAHGLTITDGSHWVMNNTGAAPSTTRILRASTTTQIVSVQSSTAPLSNQKICAYGTVFTSSFSCGSSTLGSGGAPFLHLVGLQLNAPGIMTNCVINGSRVAGGTYQNCNIFGGVFTAATSLIDGDWGRRTMFNSLFLSGVTLSGPRSSVQQCVFSNTGNPCMAIGTTGFSSPPVPQHPGSGVKAVSAVDFEGSGIGIMATGNSYFIGAGSITFALTNRAIDAAHGALFASSVNHTWSGTVTAPSLLRSRAWFNKTGITYSVSNTASPGQDFNVGALSTIVAASSSIMDLSDLSSYQ